MHTLTTLEPELTQKPKIQQMLMVLSCHHIRGTKDLTNMSLYYDEMCDTGGLYCSTALDHMTLSDQEPEQQHVVLLDLMTAKHDKQRQFDVNFNKRAEKSKKCRTFRLRNHCLNYMTIQRVKPIQRSALCSNITRDSQAKG